MDLDHAIENSQQEELVGLAGIVQAQSPYITTILHHTRIKEKSGHEEFE
jgi:hypothetical protein